MKKYLWQHPRGFLYVRNKGKYLGRITAPEGTPEFDRQYWEILNGKRAEASKSWAKLIASYRQSNRWENLKPRTRADYEKVLIYLGEKIGSKDVTRLIRKDVIDAQDANKHRVRFANYVPQVMSVLCEHAINIGWLVHNPAKGVDKLRTSDDRKQPHIPWTDYAVAIWRAEAAPLPRLIFEIGVGSVQRPSD
jgi:hypothetical protein